MALLRDDLEDVGASRSQLTDLETAKTRLRDPLVNVTCDTQVEPESSATVVRWNATT